MNSFGKTFLSLSFFGLVGTGIYFDFFKGLDVYKDMIKQPLKKKISVKPEDVRDKQPQLDSWLVDHNEYTFFDTLDDASMSKFIGLNESVVESEKLSNRKISEIKPKIKRKYILQSNNKASNDLLSSFARNKGARIKVSPLQPGFILQVGSFKTLARANLLKKNLIEKGYSTFVLPTSLSERGEVWNRVVIGSYAEKETAVKAAIEIKKMEHLDSVVMWHEGHNISRN